MVSVGAYTIGGESPYILPFLSLTRAVVVPLQCRYVHCRGEYRHYSSNRHYSAHCHSWFFASVPNDSQARQRATATTQPALERSNHCTAKTVAVKVQVLYPGHVAAVLFRIVQNAGMKRGGGRGGQHARSVPDTLSIAKPPRKAPQGSR